jgi:hypothetical protein
MVVPPHAPTQEQAFPRVLSHIPAASRPSLSADSSAEHAEDPSVPTPHLHAQHVLKAGAEEEYTGPLRPLDAVPRDMHPSKHPRLVIKHLTKASVFSAPRHFMVAAKTVQQLVSSRSS